MSRCSPLSRDVVAREHVVDEQAERGDRRVEPGRFGLGILADQRGDDDARLVQHDMAETDALAEAEAGDGDRPLQVERVPGRREPFELADRDHLGEHHGGRLQRLDFFVVVGAMRAVLDDEYAERAAGAQDRHAEEG